MEKPFTKLRPPLLPEGWRFGESPVSLHSTVVSLGQLWGFTGAVVDTVGAHMVSPRGGGVLSSFLKHQCQQKRTQLQFSLLRALRKMEQKEPPRAGSWPFSNKTSDFNKQPPVSHQQSTMVFFWLRPPSFANLTTPSPAAWRGFCRD